LVKSTEKQRCKLFPVIALYLFLHVVHFFHQNLSLFLQKVRDFEKLQQHHLAIFVPNQDYLPKRPTEEMYT
jgi:hypothetical protein